MSNLLKIEKEADIPKEYRGTPIGLLLEYHNLKRSFDVYTQAQILIGMCMDSRKHLRVPDNFAFIIRTGGANLRYSEFRVSYAIAVGGAQQIALIGHTQCGMSNLQSRRELFIQGMVDRAGWDAQRAEAHFDQALASHEIGDESAFVISEANRLEKQYPKIKAAPFIYKIEDNLLYAIQR